MRYPKVIKHQIEHRCRWAVQQELCLELITPLYTQQPCTQSHTLACNGMDAVCTSFQSALLTPEELLATTATAPPLHGSSNQTMCRAAPEQGSIPQGTPLCRPQGWCQVGRLAPAARSTAGAPAPRRPAWDQPCMHVAGALMCQPCRRCHALASADRQPS